MPSPMKKMTMMKKNGGHPQRLGVLKKKCLKDPTVRRIEEKIAYTTSVMDMKYFEHLQLLKYVGGQYYKEHHDEEDSFHDKPHAIGGPRILTFFLYLNDVD